MDIKIERKTALLLLLAILAGAVLLRVFDIGHVLSWDEAWNVHTSLSGSLGLTGSGFFYNFWRHPPIYPAIGMLFGILGAGKAGIAIGMEITSLVASLATVVGIYLCGREWFSEEAGLAAAFFYSVMPAARVFDTWIKPDSMTVAFGIFFFYFFFRKRYIISGLFLGLSLLTKVVAVFFPLAVLVFLLASRRFDRLKGFGISILTGGILSFWWFLFLSKSTGAFTDFFLGRGTDAAEWYRPWYYYFKRLPEDIGWVLLAVTVVGLFFLVKGLIHRSRPRPADPDGPEMALLCVCWMAAVYLPLAISHGKPAWMTYVAMPAFALFGGWSLFRIAKALSARRVLAISAVALVLVLALVFSLLGGFNRYMLKAESGFENAVAEKQAAEYLNDKMRDSGVLLLDFGDFGLPPHFLYYLDAYDPERIASLPVHPSGKIPPPGLTVLVVNNDTPIEEVERYILEAKPEYVAVVHLDDAPDAPYTRLAERLAELAEPDKFRVMWVFDGEKLRESLGENPQ